MVQIQPGLVVIESGYSKRNVFLVAYAMQAGGPTLLPRGGVSARLKLPNNSPQLVLIGNLPGNFSGDPTMARAPNKLLWTMAAAKAALRHFAFPARFQSPKFLIKVDLSIFGAEPPQGPDVALASFPSPCPTPLRSSRRCSLTPHPHAQDMSFMHSSHWTKNGVIAWPCEIRVCPLLLDLI